MQLQGQSVFCPGISKNCQATASRYLNTMKIGSNIIFHESLSSTNTEASELLRKDDPPEGTVIHTAFQTSGRGHAGNRWISERGKNLLFSIILYPQSVDPGDQFMLSMTISLGIIDFLDKHVPGAAIKWPNDICVNDRKIAGILIEHSILGTAMENSVAGIGININQKNFKGIEPDPVSLKTVTGKEFNITDCLNDVLAGIDMRYKQLLYGDRKLIKKDYLSRLWKIMEWHLFRSEGVQFTGKIVNVTDTGSIVIETDGGETKYFSFKEISYLA